MMRNCLLCVVETQPYYQEIDCVLESINVNVKQYLSIVDVKAEFHYTNPSEKLLEADFQFPLENSASVYHFEMATKDNSIVAECKGKSEATETYEKAKEEGHTAALAYTEESTPDVFKIKLGNIPPKEKVKITLMFTFMTETVLNEIDSDKLSREIFFQLPQVLNPRYSPDTGNHQITSNQGNNVYVANTPYKFSFEAQITCDHEIKEVTSPNLKYITEHLDKDKKRSVKVTLAEEFDRKHDIELHTHLVPEEMEKSSFSVFYEKGSTGENSFLSKHCVVASFRPPKMEKFKETRNEFIFVIDRSGSMEGINIESAKESLMLFLKSLPKESRMQIIGFGSSFKELFEQPVDITKENMDKALAYQKSMTANMGGTEMYGALKHAFDSPLSGDGWQKQIILITDGEVWNIEEIKTLCVENAAKGRVFAIGLGEGASTALVSGIAEASHGKAVFVRNPSDLRKAVMEIFKLSVQSRASDVKVDWKLSSAVKGKFFNIPSKIGCVYADSPLLCFALFDGDVSDLKGTATLSYMMKGEKCELSGQFGPENELKIANDKLPVHRIASKIQLNELNAKLNTLEAVNKESNDLKAVKDQMKLLSIESNVVSRVTAYVCVDPKKQDKVESITLISSPQMRATCYSRQAAACSLPYEITSPPVRPKDNYMKLIEENDFSGCWKKSDTLVKIIEDVIKPKTIDDALKAKPSKVSDDAWITIIVLQLFEVYYKDQEIEWSMISEKAETWINEQGCDFKELQAIAKKYITK